MKKGHWLEFLKDNNMRILYHPGKEKYCCGSLRQKSTSMGSLVDLLTQERPLALEIQSFSNHIVRLDISTPECVFSFM